MNGQADRDRFDDYTANGRRIYAVTLKQTGQNDTTLSEIIEAMSQSQQSLKSKQSELLGAPVFERDSKGKLHAHYVLRSRSFQFTKFQLKGWHVHFQDLKTSEDLKKWLNYLNKCPMKIPVLQQEEARKYYDVHNGFV